jgi:hypothetical protein
MLLKCVPSFKSHHGDPRFTDLLRRLGWPEYVVGVAILFAGCGRGL